MPEYASGYASEYPPDYENFIESIINDGYKDVDLLLNNLFKRISAILDSHGTLRKVTKKETLDLDRG